MRKHVIWTSLVASTLFMACQKESVMETPVEVERTAVVPAAVEADRPNRAPLETAALRDTRAGVDRGASADDVGLPAGELPSSEVAIEGRVLARAKLFAMQEMAGVTGDARIYRNNEGERIQLSLTGATPGSYGVFLGSDCGRPAEDMVDSQRATARVRSETLINTVDVGADGRGQLDAPMPEAHDALAKTALILMPKTAGHPVKKLACGHVLPDRSADDGS